MLAPAVGLTTGWFALDAGLASLALTYAVHHTLRVRRNAALMIWACAAQRACLALLSA
jgi:hypothetical protein